MERDIAVFIDTFVREVEEENAAIFAGAGLSVAAGFVNWKQLLKPIAQELGLNIDQEHDLISLAQYHVNERQNRSGLNSALIEQFTKGHKASNNHKIIARLPIKTYWTTNYDTLIEDTLKQVGKIPDIKYTVDQLKLTKPRRDAIVYKMHGDIEHPDNAVLTKDDYEQYWQLRAPFVTALSGDLVSKTFLFLGFSFTDPNLDYILSRVRTSLHGRPRQHYCIFKKCNRQEFASKNAFRYAEIKQDLAVSDLKRFGIHTLLVAEYGEITELLSAIEDRYQQKTIFISGSADEYGKVNREEAEEFIETLSSSLVHAGRKIVSGFGLGVGSHVITGVLRRVYEAQGELLHDQLILRPFPQGLESSRQWEQYRKDMISRAGAAIFLYGNKLHEGKVASAQGVRREFEIAKGLGLKLIPVGATGYMARELWHEIKQNFNDYYPNSSANLRNAFISLGDESKKLGQHIETIIRIFELLNKV